MTSVRIVLFVLFISGLASVVLKLVSVSLIADIPNFKVLEVPLPSQELLSRIPRDHANKLKEAEITFAGQIFGPESVVFDSLGRGPYSGVADGRVVRWEGEEKGWVDFATVVPNRTEICDPLSPLGPNLKYEHLCGRPLGLRFNKRTGDLFIADAYFGLMRVGPEGGLAELVADEAEGQKMAFCNDLDIDDDGTVYFTDSSLKYPRSKFLLPLLEGEDTGRLMKWNPETKETTVLVRGLRFANGVSFSKDHSFLLVSETASGKLYRYWVRGPKSGTLEDFAWLPGYPDNVRTNNKGEFWVALHCRRNAFDTFFKKHPALKKPFLRLPFSRDTIYRLFVGKPHGVALRYNEDGELLEVLEDQNGQVVSLISEIEEHNGKLYMGSVLLPHMAIYTLEARPTE